MVSIVVVSHSKQLAEGVVHLVRMTSKKVKIKAAGGLENGDYGTSIDTIRKAIDEVYSEDGVIVLVDIGSAIMTTEMAIEERNDPKIILSKASLVEGAFAASIYAENELPIEDIINTISNEHK